MQIRLSWQRLLALVIFVSAIGVLAVAFFPRSQPVPAVTQISPVPAAAAEDAVQAFFATSTALAMPTAPPTATAVPTDVPTATVPPTPTLEPVPTPSGSLGAATATLSTSSDNSAPQAPTADLPTLAIPTPIPERLRLLSIGFGQQKEHMSYAFIVENPNPTLLMRDTLYQLAAYDAAGTVLSTESSSIDLVYPGQQLPVAKVLRIPPNVEVVRVEVQFLQRTFAEATGQIPQFEIENPAFVPNPDELSRITGIVHNTTPQDLSDLVVVGVAYDREEIVGGGTASIPFIPAQGKAAISIPIATSRNVTRVTLFPKLPPLALP